MSANTEWIAGTDWPNGRNRWSRCQFLATVFFAIGLTVSLFSFVTADPDLWGHLIFGKAHWHTGQLAQTNLYSFTATQYPWINHEWLSELIFYLVYRTMGDAGLLFGKLGIGFSAVAVIFVMCGIGRGNWLIHSMVISLAVFVMSPGFMIRPQLFSFLFFIICYYLFYLYFEKNRNLLFLVPFVIALWSNLHGGFLMGLALFFCVAAWNTFQRGILERYQKPVGTLWIYFGISCLAVFANPYGYRLPVFLFKSLTISRNISEWQPVPIFDASFPAFKIMAALFVLAFAADKNRLKRWAWLFLVLLMVVSFRQQRHTPFFGMAAAPYLVSRLSDTVSRMSENRNAFRFSDTAVNLLVVTIWIASGLMLAGGMIRYFQSSGRIIVDPGRYPIAAVRFLQTNDIGGNLLVPFDWGEYAIWKRYPASLVSIDGRFRTAYPESVIQDHLLDARDERGWRNLLSRYPADILLVQQTPFFQSMVRETKAWTYVYSDPMAIVFVRNNAKNRRLIEKFRSGRFVYPNSPPSIYFP